MCSIGMSAVKFTLPGLTRCPACGGCGGEGGKNEEEESEGEEMRRITRVADSTHASSSCCGPPSPGRMVHWWKNEMVKWCKAEM